MRHAESLQNQVARADVEGQVVGEHNVGAGREAQEVAVRVGIIVIYLSAIAMAKAVQVSVDQPRHQ